MRKTKKKLFKFLEELAATDPDYIHFKGIWVSRANHSKVSDKIDGLAGRVYIQTETKAARYKLERILLKNDFTVNREYSPNTPSVEIIVRYFKGWHWNR